MTRRRATPPWIHRWSRPIMGAIAVAGAIGTGYLTIVKLTGGTAACPTEGCERVLSSPYATVFGLPLTLFGFLAYFSMAVFALAPLAISETARKELRSQVENWTWWLLFFGATSMMIFSGYLMYLLAFEIKTVCFYCVGSALFSLALFVLTLLGRSWPDLGQLAFTGVIVGMVALIGTLGLYANATGSAPNGGATVEAGAPPPATTTSGPAEIALAEHLTQIGAKEYGAYWCPHCFDQKQLFGAEASKKLNYVECDPEGQNSQTSACQAAGIQGYPTWEIKGELYSGTQSLETLAEISGYTGPRDFKN
ncbi:vitamin K epoxide reductase family protein [Geitlerinema sp. PCC 7407]|uniref:vitamin K epoxide reductase family protein n=1 Tax=Geitlerinema sp. PCC 7407 TaxID=1173025 RepID=UPI00029FA906|nr:vitamin K epoxide reductase family protein [Geitlerinema sp. PCC 7407]AFY67524.1 Vitamin K epoxide reductase [Geitlerinema sp. PCC 7407]